MGVNLYNSAGYVDPTAYEALTNIEKEEKLKRKDKLLKNKKNKKTNEKIKTGGVR